MMKVHGNGGDTGRARGWAHERATLLAMRKHARARKPRKMNEPTAGRLRLVR